ncbi:MAG TPA: hypothetical protein VFN21_09180 [Acidimicrobiales bacterium]|nr:hypothetical protein [Acidimicrobiales bacterium]
MTRTLVVICEDWPIRAARQTPDHDAEPIDPARPTAVWSHRGIVATNPTARAVGVQVGLRRREAQGRCPELLLIAEDPARDARCFDPVVAALSAFTPLVEIVEPGVAALGTRGPSRYFGGDDALAMRIHRAVTEVIGDPDRSTVRVGVADGPLIAHLAARMAAPHTPKIVPAGTAPSFLAPLPLRALVGLVATPDILATWTQLGLRTLGDVAALPAAAVLGRFGTDGTRLQQLARGRDPTTSAPTPLPEEVDTVLDFDPPETRADAVAFAVRATADSFARRLVNLGLSCAQVVVTLSTDHAEEHQRRWRLDGPGRSAEQTRPPAVLIAERVRWQTDGWLTGSNGMRPSAGITRVLLAPGEVRPARGAQLGFWGGASAADERAAHAVARLEALVGPDAVCVIEPRGGRHPGSETALVPTATADLGARSPLLRSSGAGREDPPWPGRLPAPSPTLVPTAPRPVEVVDTEGTSVGVSGRGELLGTPATMRFAGDDRHPRPGRSTTITAWAGPWPVDERWWDPERRQRQARLQLVTAEGDALLVTRQHHRWWLTAVYG